MNKSKCKRKVELNIMLTISILKMISDSNTETYKNTLSTKYDDDYNSEKIEKGKHAQIHADILISMVFIRFRSSFQPHRCYLRMSTISNIWIRLDARICKFDAEDPDSHANKKHDDNSAAETGAVVIINWSIAAFTPSVGYIVDIIWRSWRRNERFCERTLKSKDSDILSMFFARFLISQN